MHGYGNIAKCSVLFISCMTKWLIFPYLVTYIDPTPWGVAVIQCPTIWSGKIYSNQMICKQSVMLDNSSIGWTENL